MTGPGRAADVAYTDQRVGHPQLQPELRKAASAHARSRFATR